MKTLKNLFVALTLLAVAPMTAQTADEILSNYFENTGGEAAWNALEGTKILGAINAQGMEIPIEIYSTKDGKQLVKINMQGQEMTMMSFDGETMWTTNFMTMLPEKSDTETTEMMKTNNQDFPSPFLNYKEKGYTVEYLGKETKEGTETFKLKLTQKPVMVDGKEEPTVSFHYFETENYVPIVVETTMNSGPAKGQMSTSGFSDYQESEGLYFPFSIDQGGQPINVKEIVLNPDVDKAFFAFPEEK
ncbi:MAG TPA: outer membrane lipoprotein-sorting protein [Flavobacteriaceae bacterium]|nr:outer membrane lipoprotein-sorting protein [Flavobacteriaceae bacterium]